jgi:hypothetical protein
MPPPSPASEGGDAGEGAVAGVQASEVVRVDTLAKWREHGMADRDPVRFRFIEALARRAAGYQGEARRVLDGKLLRALEAYRAKVAATVSADGPADRPAEVPAPQESLADLLRELATDKAGAPELKAVSRFRSTWSRLGVEQRLSQSRAKVPGNAGPLNSHALVLRSLTLMREISPHYLTRFVGHVDALLWLEQANGGQAVLQKDVLGAEPEKPRKSGRGRAKPAE